MDNYDVNSIKSLSAVDSIRLKASMYIGTTSQDGVNQLVYEIWDNSLDEYCAGYGNEIDVLIDKDNYVTIKDYGRGVPANLHPEWKNEDGTPMYTLTGIFTKIHAGGKLFADGSSGYFSTVGVYGVGSTVVNCLSDYFEVTSYRDGKIYNQKFSKGIPISNVEITDNATNSTGTIIKFHPDSTIFKSTIQPNDKKLQNRLDEITSLNVNLKINYKNELANTEHTFCYPNGISDYIKNKLLKDKPLLFDTPIYYKSEFIKDDEKVQVEFALMYVDDVESNEIIKTFANNVSTKEHGTHLQGFKEGYKETINQYAINKKWINEPIEIKYLLDNICLIISVKLKECELDGQTKNKLGNIIAREGVSEVIKEFFSKLTKEQQSIIQTIIERANKVKEAEEAARRARINTRKANKVNRMSLPGKLADCSNNKGYTELFLVEGDSAGGCFVGDTLVKLLDGRNIPIQQIVEEHRQGKKNYVYCSTKNGDIRIQKIENAFKTKTVNEVCEIMLDNNKIIKCTKDHLFMLRDGTYKEAQYLTNEDSLMPLYIKYNDTNYNHKIKSVKFIYYENGIDVYDLTIPIYHNFALSDGVFVHNSAKDARFREFQAILPLRGKILNVEKTGFDKMINSDVIQSLIASIGTGIDKKFNINKCRYDKVIIMTDADVDGYHIMNLLLTFIYNYMRPLIEQGYVYATTPPLYKIITKKTSIYIKDDYELKEYKRKHPNIDIKVQRFKGLGEMNANELKETTMDPKTRILKKITINDIDDMIQSFNVCMGSDVNLRRRFIEENAHKAILDY